MSAKPSSKWTATLVAAAAGILSGFALGRLRAPAPVPPAAPIKNAALDKQKAQHSECLATLPLTISSVAVDEPGAPKREGPDLHVADGQQIRVAARGQPDDDQGLAFSVDSDGLVRPIWPTSGISAPCPGGCGAFQIALPASTLPPGSSLIAVYVGFRRFELPAIQDAIRNMGAVFLETKRLPIVWGARAGAAQLVTHGNPPPSP
jgi:hypothetical protein